MPHDAPVAHEAHLAVNGLSTWTATQGSGPPVVLCHGGPGSYDYLEPVAAMIDGMATVHRYDQRGCGRTESRGPWDVRTFVDDLDALRAHWGHGSWTLVGHSWGAMLVLLYAIRHPRRARGLVLISGTGIDPAWHADYRRNREAGLSPRERDRLRRLEEDLAHATGPARARMERERSRLLARADYFDARPVDELPHLDRFPANSALNERLNAELARMEEAGGLPSQIARVAVPTLLVDGAGDPRPRWARAQMARLIPPSRHATIAGAGHYPWVEQPDALAGILRTFLDELGEA